MSLFAGTELYRPPKCDRCQKLETECDCPPVDNTPAPLPPEKQTARLQLEKRKKGKLVTVIRGLDEGTPEPHLSAFLTKLKNICGAGGSIQSGAIEIQGDHLASIRQHLADWGYRVK
ncbi:MAG: translation initiation factor [Planctomycetota bacterium]